MNKSQMYVTQKRCPKTVEAVTQDGGSRDPIEDDVSFSELKSVGGEGDTVPVNDLTDEVFFFINKELIGQRGYIICIEIKSQLC